jgi:CubicO group peptidase (beta-lactamase class C family)
MRKKILFLFLPVLFSSINFISGSQDIKSKNARAELIAEVDSILQSQVDLDKIPGAVIEIKKGQRVIYKQAYGYARKYDYNHMELNSPEKMTTRHLFDIASLTKVIGTTTAVMLLADRGMINTEDPVCRYIKAFDTPDKRTITIRHLLTHTGGLYDWYPLYYRSDNKKETFRLIAELPLKFPVGEERHYSDLGFMLLGEIVENISGLALEQFLKQNVFKPLGMKNTTYNPLTSGRYKRIASTSNGNPYEKRMVYDTTLGFRFREIDPTEWNGWRAYTLRGEANDGNTWYASGGISGAAGLFSTAGDLQKLVDMILNKGEIHRGQFISARTIDTFLTKDKFNNGLGWMMDPVNSFMKNGPEGTFGHTGFTGTSITVIPQSGVSVILLINRQNTGLSVTGEYYNVNPVRQQVFNAVLNYSRN